MFKRAGREALLLRGGAAGRDPLHARRRACATTCSRPEPVAKADFFVNCPKFKAHPWTTVTFSMKNYIGIQDDRHRLIDHDHRLNEKIADLQYIIQPQFIAIDAIIAGRGADAHAASRSISNLIIMGNNQVAFDAVCCAHHRRRSARASSTSASPRTRGFGTTDLRRASRSRGDVTLDEARAQAPRASRSAWCASRSTSRARSITAYAGPPPEPEQTDYCWGGCPGAIEEAIEILRLYDKEMRREDAAAARRVRRVRGADRRQAGREGGVHRRLRDAGRARSHGKLVEIESIYKDRSTEGPAPRPSTTTSTPRW